MEGVRSCESLVCARQHGVALAQDGNLQVDDSLILQSVQCVSGGLEIARAQCLAAHAAS